jgi:hypothetical protein
VKINTLLLCYLCTYLANVISFALSRTVLIVGTSIITAHARDPARRFEKRDPTQLAELCCGIVRGDSSVAQLWYSLLLSIIKSTRPLKEPHSSNQF